MQLSLVLGILLVVAVAAIIILLAELEAQRGRGKDVALPGPVEDPVELNRYGHRFSPVSEIRQRLPKLGDRHLWESWVDTSSGEPIFTLNLLESSVEGERIIARRQVNFERDGRPWTALYATWTATYASFSGSLNREARAGLVSPTVEWAIAQTNLLYGTREGHAVQR
ncbi:hypothetical protein [Rhodococcus erythropolis]|uniref:hypothetical protein n=1 Tax=Rhodococcus erythropolis TaxID=1833 RepID=UPI001BE965C6|nr:hypothetical protein [Rhodococcus erythropolis]MBT2266423.1 hypothetical protein [Rhodococcus erythropolis]